MTVLQKFRKFIENDRMQEVYTKEQLLAHLDLLLIPLEEEQMKDWNKAWEEAMRKRFNEGVEALYTNVSHGKMSEGFLGYIDKMGTAEKPVNVETITDPIIEKLKAKFDERSLVGINKYGTTLEQNNDDDFLNHLLEELMDASAYIMKLIDQREKNKNNLL
jgi:hypothetical protein